LSEMAEDARPKDLADVANEANRVA
jgi:hypothetical protein